MSDVLDAWKRWMVAQGLPSTTIGLRSYHLGRLRRAQSDPLRVSTEDLVTWLAAHGDWSPETRRSYRASFRAFFSWAVSTGRLEVSPAAALPPVRVPIRCARPIPEDALEEALRRAPERVRLMVELASRCGLRRGELARVRGDDVERDLVGWSLLVHGKGRRERLVPLPDGLAWMVRRAAQEGCGWCFPGHDGGHLSPHRVGDLVAAALPGGWTAHTLRHRFATNTWAQCHDLAVVQELLGHAKPETTRLYVQVSRASLRAAVAWAA